MAHALRLLACLHAMVLGLAPPAAPPLHVVGIATRTSGSRPVAAPAESAGQKAPNLRGWQSSARTVRQPSSAKLSQARNVDIWWKINQPYTEAPSTNAPGLFQLSDIACNILRRMRVAAEVTCALPRLASPLVRPMKCFGALLLSALALVAAAIRIRLRRIVYLTDARVTEMATLDIIGGEVAANGILWRETKFGVAALLGDSLDDKPRDLSACGAPCRNLDSASARMTSSSPAASSRREQHSYSKDFTSGRLALIAGLDLSATNPPMCSTREVARRQTCSRMMRRATAIDERVSRGWQMKKDLYAAGYCVMEAASGASVDVSQRRFNVLADEVQTFTEMRLWAIRERFSFCSRLMTVELERHPSSRSHPLFGHGQTLERYWRTFCLPLAALDDGSICIASKPVELRRLWTSADTAHVHAVSGALYMLTGLVYLLDAASCDLEVVNSLFSGYAGTPLLPQHLLPNEFAVVSLGLGAVNAATGLQPALLAPSRRGLMEALGFGERGDLRSGGFVNAFFFWYVLAYQSVRVMPWFPTVLWPLDPVVGVASIMAMQHSKHILDGFVKDRRLRPGDIEEFFVPGQLNLPVSLHLIFQNQAWVDFMAASGPNCLDSFSTSNFALAWASSAVTFVLSLYERGAISKDSQRSLIGLVPLGPVVVVLLEFLVSSDPEKLALTIGKI